MSCAAQNIWSVSSVYRAYLLPGQGSNGLSHMASLTAIGMGVLLATSTTSGKQDIASMVFAGNGSTGWSNFLEASPAGSTHKAELVFATDMTITGATGSALPKGASVNGLGDVAFRQKKGSKASTPDETRIVKAGKTSRLVKITPVAAPKGFSAGSVLERHSMFQPLLRAKMLKWPLRSAKKRTEVWRLLLLSASQSQKLQVQLPTALAISRGTVDVLATAYAPQPQIDFARNTFHRHYKVRQQGAFYRATSQG